MLNQESTYLSSVPWNFRTIILAVDKKRNMQKCPWKYTCWMFCWLLFLYSAIKSCILLTAYFHCSVNMSAHVNGQGMCITEWWKEYCICQIEQIRMLFSELKMACMYNSQNVSCLSLIKLSQLSQLGNEGLNSSSIRPII